MTNIVLEMDAEFEQAMQEMQDEQVMWEGFATYQEKAYKFRAFPDTGVGNLYPVLALAEETGEAVGKIAKAVRKGSEVDKDALSKELGDVLWNVSAVAKVYGLKLGDIALNNLAKLSDREERGVIVGEGDGR